MPSLAENIKAFRLKKNYTQEKLAEQMGVSVGAVSKWESGQSTPELPILLSLAEFFQISLDRLISYKLSLHSMEEAELAIRRCTQEKRYKEGVSLVEESLLNFPNEFPILRRAAQFYYLKGLETVDEKSTKRGLDLLLRAEALFPNVSEPGIKPQQLRLMIASSYLNLGEVEEALKIYKEENIGSSNYLDIAQVLVIHQGKYEEALPFLSGMLYREISNMFNLALVFSLTYLELDQAEEALDILQLIWPLIEGLRMEDNCVIFAKMGLVYRCNLALTYFRLEQVEEARTILKEVHTIATTFDWEKEWKIEEFPHFFVEDEGDVIAYDDFGSEPLRSVKKWLENIKGEDILSLWEEILHEEGHAE